MNVCNKNFLERNGINPDELRKKVDCNLYEQNQINPIVFDYGFQEKRGEQNISVADIIGYYSNWKGETTDIFRSMDSYFDSNGDGYHSRSVGMLEYSKDNILSKLQESFSKEPISVCETGEGNYTIFTNGLHRFTLLRILYLQELAKANQKPQLLKALREKYTIPVELIGINMDNTYCKYLLDIINSREQDKYSGIKRLSWYYEDFQNTGKIRVGFQTEEPDEIITSEKLLEITKNRLVNNIRNRHNFDLDLDIGRYSSFNRFMRNHFRDVIDFDKIFESGGPDYV